MATHICYTGTRIYRCMDYRISYYCNHHYMDTRYTVMSCLHITVTPACMVSLFLSYGSLFLIHVLLFHVIVFMLHDYFLLLTWTFPIRDTRAVDRRYVGIPHLLFPFPVILFPYSGILFYAINRAQVLLSCYPYHVLYLFLLPCILDLSDQKDNLGMGETRRLIRSYRVDVWIHCSSHYRGRGSAGYRLLFMLHVTALAGWPWSQ